MTTLDQDPVPRPAARSRRLRSSLVAAGAAAGLTLAGLGVAAAQSDTTAPAQSDTGTAQTGPDPGAEAPADAARGRAGHKGGRRHGPMAGIHGEQTTRAPGGGYQVVANQVGEVTEVSASSLSVRSEDGFSRTYAVDDDTMVKAGDQGIADVKTGDQVRVVAIVTDGTARAKVVHDATRSRELHDRWAPPGPGRPDGQGD